MNRTDILNFIAKTIGAKTYLEIGVANGRNFRAIEVNHKIGVDPSPHSLSTHKTTSDAYFQTCDIQFDLVFIDGLHNAEQVERDIQNSLKVLSKHGAIVLHDCNPPHKDAAKRNACTVCWCGDVYKGWIRYRSRAMLETFTIDTDLGCGVILNKSGSLLEEIGDLSWEDFSANKKRYLELVNVDEALKRISNGD